MLLKAIHTQEDYQHAMSLVDALWDSPEGSPEADYLEIVAILIEEYEKKHYSLPALDPL